MSNANRIAKLAAEAEATAQEKAQMRAQKAAQPRRTRKPSQPKVAPRMKIVWAVGAPGSTSPKIFPYPAKAAADAEAARLGKGNIVTALKVPME
jgi:hypothetical protein